MTPLIFAIIGITLVVLTIDGLLQFSYKNLWGFNVKDQMRYLIEDTIKLYSVRSNRAYDEESTVCQYRTGDLKMCALGHRFYRYNKLIEGILPNTQQQFELLKKFIDPIYHQVPMRFWEQLQNLHDTKEYWYNGGGLSESGERYVNILKANFGL